MQRATTTRRTTALWVAALMLVQSAMTLFGVGAAQAQGRARVEVCTGHGIVTVAVDASDESAPAVPAHADASCCPGGCAPPLPAATGVGAPSGAVVAAASVPWAQPLPAQDRSASWFAAIGHAPPPRG